MCPKEIIAYKGEDASGLFGDIEVFDGTEEQLLELKQLLIDSWREIDGTEIEIVYQGPDAKAAQEAIAGLPRTSENVGF